MRWIATSFATLVAIALVAIAVFIGVTELASRRSSIVTALLPASGPEPTRGARPATGPASPAPPPAPPSAAAGTEVQLGRVTETELTELARQRLSGVEGGLSVANPRVRIVAERIEVTAELRGLPVAIPILVVGRAAVVDRRPTVVVERLEGVGLTLPAAAREAIESRLNSLSFVTVPPDVELTRITLDQGALTVFGRRRPR